MKAIDQFQLYLFDFDGLLVNTEQLHFKAYRQMLSSHGYSLPWDWTTYCSHAHQSSAQLQKAIYTACHGLITDWEILYSEKKALYLELLQQEGTSLMPGAAALLQALAEAHIKRCIVTHSPREQVLRIAEQNPLLKTVPYWITREDYSTPKPHPACYLKAISDYALPDERVIGFEDSPRGLRALLPTRAQAVLVSSQISSEQLASMQSELPAFAHYDTLQSWFEEPSGQSLHSTLVPKS